MNRVLSSVPRFAATKTGPAYGLYLVDVSSWADGEWRCLFDFAAATLLRRFDMDFTRTMIADNPPPASEIEVPAVVEHCLLEDAVREHAPGGIFYF
jgi:hypothetical protein